jgi:tRNA(adenine34) deaminase
METENYRKFMEIAIDEAKKSLKEGNKGFGAVLVKNGEIVAVAHDTILTDADPTAHGEMNVIRKALKEGFKDLAGCVIFSTHEPCPMCTGAIVWAKMSEIVYGASIKDTLALGRNMIDLSCDELIERSPWRAKVTKGVLRKQCLPLYIKDSSFNKNLLIVTKKK